MVSQTLKTDTPNADHGGGHQLPVQKWSDQDQRNREIPLCMSLPVFSWSRYWVGCFPPLACTPRPSRASLLRPPFRQEVRESFPISSTAVGFSIPGQGFPFTRRQPCTAGPAPTVHSWTVEPCR